MNTLKQIVVGIDFSECSRTALAQAVRIAAFSGTPIRAVHIVERSLLEQVNASLEHPPEDIEAKVVSHAKYGVERMVAEAGGGKDVGIDVVIGPAAAELVRIAEEAVAGENGLLVMGSSGQSHPARGVGTTAGRCVRHGPTDVLLVRKRHAGAFKHIVACVDFSETSIRALREAVALAKRDGSEVLALNVFSPPPQAYPPADMIGLWPIPAPDYAELAKRLRESSEKALSETIGELGAAAEGVKIVPHVMEEFSYGRGICQFAKSHGADLVVIGTQGRSNLRYMLLGSTAEKVLREVECSVLAVKPPGHTGVERGR